MAAAQLRAPLYEGKVVDFLFSKAKVSERKASRAELEADLESEEGHVHGPGCGHEHLAAAKSGKGKHPAKAKPAAKKADIVEPKSAAPKPAKPLKSEPANKADDIHRPELEMTVSDTGDASFTFVLVDLRV